MTAKPWPSAEVAFHTATSFHGGAMRCLESIPHETKPRVVISHTGPGLVCAAFAAEMYMKAICLARGVKQEGHNLKWLFEKALLDKERHLVASNYEIVTGRTLDQLLNDIEGFARAFTEWRYVFEAKSKEVNSFALLSLVRALYLTARSIAPNWAVDDQEHRRLTENPKDVWLGYESEGLQISDFLKKFGINLPQTDIAVGEKYNFDLTARVFEFDGKSTAVHIKPDRAANLHDFTARHLFEK